MIQTSFEWVGRGLHLSEAGNGLSAGTAGGGAARVIEQASSEICIASSTRYSGEMEISENGEGCEANGF
jgi:hypothetical protein